MTSRYFFFLAFFDLHFNKYHSFLFLNPKIFFLSTIKILHSTCEYIVHSFVEDNIIGRHDLCGGF